MIESNTEVKNKEIQITTGRNILQLHIQNLWIPEKYSSVIQELSWERVKWIKLQHLMLQVKDEHRYHHIVPCSLNISETDRVEKVEKMVLTF